MANLLNRRYWILSLLLSAGFVLVVLICTAQASLLRDIRVGEYENFTRVVFEFDEPTEPEQIVSRSAGQLTVVFAGTSAELTRKIPVERSRRIKTLQIWDKKSHLSAVLSFNFVRLRHQLFPLNNPPRIVLDIQPLDSTPDTTTEMAPAALKSNGGKQPQVPESTLSGPADSEVQESSPAVQETEQRDAGVKPDNQTLPISNTNIEAGPAAQDSGIKNRGETAAETPNPAPMAGARKPAKQSGRLQFYLVVGLVLITIVILLLLLLMLLSKNRWAEDKTRLNSREILRKQDKHIASLDARIQEQLKRYEEA